MIPFLICITVILFLATIILIILNANKNKQINNLKENIESFVEGGERTEYSTADSNFARLQNAVAELENLLLLEKAIPHRRQKAMQILLPIFHISSKLRLQDFVFTVKWSRVQHRLLTRKKSFN